MFSYYMEWCATTENGDPLQISDAPVITPPRPHEIRVSGGLIRLSLQGRRATKPFGCHSHGGLGRLAHAPRVIDELREAARSKTPEDVALADLTGQERRIVEMIVHGLRNREIAAELSLAELAI